jgi:glutathionylspermidine synthase
MPGKATKTPPEQFSRGWLSELDGRLAIAQSLRQRFKAIESDMGGDLTYMQASLVERGLFLELWLSQQEQALAKGEEFNSAAWVQSCNALQGIYNRLGLQRRAKAVPSLSAYIASKQ